MKIIELEELGRRICIIGPSSTGKSTLAKLLGENLQVKVCYLDQLAHVPYTNWKLRDKSLFSMDHQHFLQQNTEWIIEGNYSALMPERFSNATSIIWLDFNRFGSLYRYIRRTIRNSALRPGNLAGTNQQFSVQLMGHILFKAPQNRKKYDLLIKESKATLVHIDSFSKLKNYYEKWEL